MTSVATIHSKETPVTDTCDQLVLWTNRVCPLPATYLIKAENHEYAIMCDWHFNRFVKDIPQTVHKYKIYPYSKGMNEQFVAEAKQEQARYKALKEEGSDV